MTGTLKKEKKIKNDTEFVVAKRVRMGQSKKKREWRADGYSWGENKNEKGERLTGIEMRVKRNTEIKGWKAEEVFGSTWKMNRKKRKRDESVRWNGRTSEMGGQKTKWERKWKWKSKTEINIEEKEGNQLWESIKLQHKALT